MRISNLFTAVVLLASVSVGAANAKSLRNAGIPAEFPPNGYSGKQYVDSNGCVFVRAGIGAHVTWVPRISRKRQHICRQNPTFAKTPTPKTPTVADVAPVVKVPTAAAKPVRRVPVKTAARPTAKPVVRAAVVTPVQAPRKIIRRVAGKPSAYRTPVVAVSAPNQPQRVVVRSAYQSQQTRCQAATSYRQVHGAGASAACSPRAQIRRIAVPKPTRAVALAAAPVRDNNADQKIVLIAPHVTPPQGYVTVWSDDRLNPNRARGTTAGKAQMDMVWTNTVPRRLIAVSTNQDTRRRISIRGLRREKRNIVVVSTGATTVIVRK